VTPPPSQLEEELSRGLLKLTLDLENNLNSKGNQVFSPTSIGAAMSLLLLGAGGHTGQEIADLLGIKNAIDTNG
jgi:serine protease inhibitor